MTVLKGYFQTGKGPAVILLHSSMSDKHQWQMLCTDLNSCFRLLSIDLAGYGDHPSPQASHDFSTRDEIEIIDTVLSAALDKDEPFHLVGHSYGGAVALALACRMKHRIRSLALFEPVPFHLLPDGSFADREIREVVDILEQASTRGDSDGATRHFMDYWSGKGTFDRLNPENKEHFKSFAGKVMLDFQALFNETLTREDYAKLDLPVCLIKGTRSPASSVEITAILADLLPQCRIHTVAGGHMAPISDFNTVNRIISQFIADLD